MFDFILDPIHSFLMALVDAVAFRHPACCPGGSQCCPEVELPAAVRQSTIEPSRKAAERRRQAARPAKAAGVITQGGTEEETQGMRVEGEETQRLATVKAWTSGTSVDPREIPLGDRKAVSPVPGQSIPFKA